MALHIYKDKDQLAEALANWICDLVNATLKSQEYFTMVLSGGSTPKILFKKLASPRFKEKINWKRVHIFWGDERVVPFNDDRNNAKIAFEMLIDHLDIPAAQVHIIRTDIEPVFAAQAYEKILHTYFDHTSSTFDLVLLGMGADGHTLSLFPGSEIIENHENWVNEVYYPAQKMYRITLMPKLVNRASAIVFMVSGSEKAGVLKKVIEGPHDPLQLPAQVIQPVFGTLHWFLDEAAAATLQQKG